MGAREARDSPTRARGAPLGLGEVTADWSLRVRGDFPGLEAGWVLLAGGSGAGRGAGGERDWDAEGGAARQRTLLPFWAKAATQLSPSGALSVLRRTSVPPEASTRRKVQNLRRFHPSS